MISSSQNINQISKTNCMPKLSRLIMNQQWKHVEDFMSSPEFEQISFDDNSSKEVTADTLIHYACRFNPPLRILHLISSKFRASLDRADSKGRYPIHLAAKYGASPESIRFLIKTNPLAAGVQDALGKTPMHYLGEFYCMYSMAINIYQLHENMLQVFKLLKEAAPTSVNLEDNEGMNVIEYAIMNNLDAAVVKAMQRACRDDWRKRKAEQKDKCHEDLAHDIQRKSPGVEDDVPEKKAELTQDDDISSTKKFQSIYRLATPSFATRRTNSARMA